MPEIISNKWNKEKPPSCCATNDIDNHLVVLDSVKFFLKKALHHRRLEILEELNIIDCLGKNF